MQQIQYGGKHRKNRGGDRDERTPLLWAQPNSLAGSAQTLNPSQFQQYFSSAGGGNYGGPVSFSRPGTPSQQQQQQQQQQFFQPQPQPTSRTIQTDGDLGKDPHSQFCALVGCAPSNKSGDLKFKFRLNDNSLYGRAMAQKRSQAATYAFTAALTNTLLLTQIILGAALTGLGGFPVPGYVITFVGALNTVIAGLVAYLKSRGQPLRARMFRDDLERVVDEIENSEVMWLGIAKGVHGYDAIDTDETVTVRSEVARLTRLYDKAVRNNTANNPELYSGAAGGATAGAGAEGGGAGGATRGGGGATQFLTLPALGDLPPVQDGDSPGDGGAGAGAGGAGTTGGGADADEDQAPASAPPKKKEDPPPAPAADKPKDPDADAKKPATSSTSTSDKKPESTAPAPASAPASTPKPPAPAPTADADKGKAAAAPKPAPAPAPSPAPAPKPADPDASPATMATTRKKSSGEVPKKEGSKLKSEE